ncbi:hypothetical protein ACZ90_71075 [Streptomyces albus subsp. albus]|nr:hypothetical protein ACZ90_71075 [Streptomyces albus subsp. albus]
MTPRRNAPAPCASALGNATLYRHFPTRQALLEAAFRDHRDALRRRAGELNSASSPGAELREWLGAVIAQGSTQRELAAERRGFPFRGNMGLPASRLSDWQSKGWLEAGLNVVPRSYRAIP